MLWTTFTPALSLITSPRRLHAAHNVPLMRNAWRMSCIDPHLLAPFLLLLVEVWIRWCGKVNSAWYSTDVRFSMRVLV